LDLLEHAVYVLVHPKDLGLSREAQPYREFRDLALTLWAEALGVQSWVEMMPYSVKLGKTCDL
jgi:hypothetical protein